MCSWGDILTDPLREDISIAQQHFRAVVLDAWSRQVISWAAVGHLRTELVLDALSMAIGQRCPTQVIHHSDQGCHRCPRPSSPPSSASSSTAGPPPDPNAHHRPRSRAAAG
jgi:transposase InsO family protein